METYTELYELTDSFLKELQDEYNFTNKELHTLKIRMVQNDVMFAQMFRMFDGFVKQEIANLREKKVQPYKKFVDVILSENGKGGLKWHTKR